MNTSIFQNLFLNRNIHSYIEFKNYKKKITFHITMSTTMTMSQKEVVPLLPQKIAPSLQKNVGHPI